MYVNKKTDILVANRKKVYTKYLNLLSKHGVFTFDGHRQTEKVHCNQIEVVGTQQNEYVRSTYQDQQRDERPLQ